MRQDYEKLHLIDRFLRNELTEEELQSFQRELLVNTELAEEVEFQKSVNELITANSFHELRQQISEDIRRMDKKTKVQNWLGLSLILIAVLGNIGVYFYITKHQAETKKTVSFTPDSAPVMADTLLKITEEPEKAIVLVEKITRDIAMPDLHSETPVLQSTKPDTVSTKVSIEDKKTPAVSQSIQEPAIEPGSTKFAPSVPEIKNPCTDSKIEASWSVVNACENKRDGSIKVNTSDFKGGTAPYDFEIVNEQNEIITFDAEQLPAGTYRLKVNDKNGCSNTWQISLGQERCLQKNVSIAPMFGEKWVYDAIEEDSYYLSIYNKAGQLIYKSNLLTGNTEWDGTNQSGNGVETGLYIYVVEYTSGKKENGQITVIR